MLNGYFKDDLNVYIESCQNPLTEGEVIASKRNNCYRFFVCLEGSFKINYNRQEFTLTKNQMLVCDIGAILTRTFVDETPFKCLEMHIHAEVFEHKAEDEFFLRAIQDLPDNERLFNLKSTAFSPIKNSVESILKCLKLELGRTHILPRICAIISELDMYFDEKHYADLPTSDSVFVNIRSYINHHFMEDMSYEFIGKKFFVSKPTIIKMFKLNTGKTMHKYIEDLRLDAANGMLSVGMDIVKIAVKCGYNNYSSFLYAYKKRFGITPNNNKNIIYERHPFV